MLVSGVILGLYIWVFLPGDVTPAALMVHDYAAIAAGVTFGAAMIARFWSPRTHLFMTAMLSYALLSTTIGLLIVYTGQLSSPFIALWMLAAVFSPVFGWYGMAVIAAMTLSLIGYVWSQEGVDASIVVTALFVSALPVVVGILGLRPGSKSATTSEDRSYFELASELSTTSNMAEAVISAIADGVVAIDKAGMIQLINPAAQKLIGWGHKDALGLDVMSVLKLVDERDQPVSDMIHPISQAIQNHTTTHSDKYSLLTADTGKKILASITTSPLGAGSGAIIVFRDVTNERAEEREQAEFISTASHEMRTPVASIEGYLGLALNPATAQIDEKARDFILKAHEAAQHLGRLFQDLLDVSRADDGRLSYKPRVVDVVQFFHDIIVGLLPKATEKHIVINYKPMPDLYDMSGQSYGERTLSPILYANVDNDHLREVLANLTENAIKYTLAGTVTIDVTGTNEHITFSITDTGIGIPKEDIGHLFQKFYRVDNSATREIGGTGLGLYLCRKLTEAMGGKIWVESVYQQGSTFFVRIPRTEHAEATRLLEEATEQGDNQQPKSIDDLIANTQSPMPAPANTPATPTTPPLPAPITTPPAPAAAPDPTPIAPAPAPPPPAPVAPPPIPAPIPPPDPTPAPAAPEPIPVPAPAAPIPPPAPITTPPAPGDTPRPSLEALSPRNPSARGTAQPAFSPYDRVDNTIAQPRLEVRPENQTVVPARAQIRRQNDSPSTPQEPSI